MAITGDCKSPAFRLRRFESFFQHHRSILAHNGEYFSLRRTLANASNLSTAAAIPVKIVKVKRMVSAAIAQLVERIHGKDEVSGSTPDRGSILLPLAFSYEICYNDTKYYINL